MAMVLQAVAWYVAIALFGAAGCGVLRRLGVGEGGAVALSRLVALTVAGYAGWLAGCAGVSQWWLVALGVAAAMLVVGRRFALRRVVRFAGEPEAIGAIAFGGVAFLRLDGLAILGTEKPMDLAIWATLLRPGPLPPPDPWLAGAALPYYYWGFVPWVAPARLLGLAPDVAYNLLVPTLAAVSAQAAWALARGLGGGRRAGWLAAVGVVFAGTPDGWRQLLGGRSLASLDLWASSRGIAGAITEFPLFTFDLGDLHPHLLAVPLLLAALFVACAVTTLPGGRRHVLPLAMLLYGAAAAANPWCAVPVGAGVAALVLVSQPPGEVGALRRWGAVAVIGLGGFLAFLPAWLALRSPFAGVGVVRTPTRWDELALYLGAALLPVLLVSWELARRLGGWRAAGRQLARAAVVAVAAVAAALSGRVGLALALVSGGLLGYWVWRGRPRPGRPAWALALVPLGLVGLVEVVYLRDPYGGELYRMNTVFKALHLAFTLLAVVGPVLLEWLAGRRPYLARAAALLLLLAGAPQLLSLALAAGRARPAGWGGLGWMAPGEAAAAHWLHRTPPGTTLVEAVGEAYTQGGRMASASGVPAVLGWENHQRVWRGERVAPELERRRNAIAELYRCGRPERVAARARELGAELVVVGELERRTYGEGGLAAVTAAGEVVFAAAACQVVRVAR